MFDQNSTTLSSVLLIRGERAIVLADRLPKVVRRERFIACLAVSVISTSSFDLFHESTLFIYYRFILLADRTTKQEMHHGSWTMHTWFSCTYRIYSGISHPAYKPTPIPAAENVGKISDSRITR